MSTVDGAWGASVVMKKSTTNRVVAPFSEKLPDAFRDEHVRSAISSDGQLYVELIGEKVPSRVESWHIDSSLLQTTDLRSQVEEFAAKPSKKKRRQSSGDNYRIVRHLLQEHRICRDCGAQVDEVRFVWVAPRCALCGSTSVDVTVKDADPPMPARIRNLGEPMVTWGMGPQVNGHIWGEDLSADGRALVQLSGAYRDAKNGHLHLYLLLAFAETLSGRVAGDGEMESFNFVLNCGNVAQRAFELTGDPEHARRMLDYFEQAAGWSKDPVLESMGKHSFGIATIYLLLRYSEHESESLSARRELRQNAIVGLREALKLVDSIRGDPDRGSAERIDVQGKRITYALAHLLSLGEATAEQLGESVELFQSLGDDIEPALRSFVRVARAEAVVRKLMQSPDLDDAAVERIFGELKEIVAVLQDGSPHFRHRGRWALIVGETILTLSAAAWKQALPWLESAVTFTVKDISAQQDPLRASNDAEMCWRVFSTLSTLYAKLGWWFEALSLLETYRGQAIELGSLDPAERSSRVFTAEEKRDTRFFGMFSPDDSPFLIAAEEGAFEATGGRGLGPFGDDYELEGLSERLLALFNQLNDEPTALLSLNVAPHTIGGVTMSAVVLGPPVDPPRPGFSKAWMFDAAAFGRLTNQSHLRPSSFREQRLKVLCEAIEQSVIGPVRELLSPFGCNRILLVAPSSLSNLPLEAFLPKSGKADSDGLPKHFAFTPSFMFGAGYAPPVRKRAALRLLIIGYSGADLPQAEEEAEALSALFGNVTYLKGPECTKRRVIEALNADYDCVHFISHGTYDAQIPLQSALHFSENRDKDASRLLAWELREFVRLRTRPVVTLSACSTALTADSRSNTWHGLPGCLLEAGARCVIGTRWPVADVVARRFMAGFYTRLHKDGASPMACFHSTQDELRADGQTEAWACFGYLGLP